MNNKILFATILILSSLTLLQAQPWMKRFENKKTPPTYFEIREAFEEYAEGKEQYGTEIAKTNDLEDMDNIIPGYEMYKRWEYFYESRIDENGNLPNEMHIWNEYLKQNTNKSLATDTSNHGNWSLVGPSVGVPIGGGMGRINVVKFNPQNSKTIWAGSPAGGLWKSINAGSTWLATSTDKLPNLGVSDIAINPIDTNVMYIATGDAVAAVGYTPSIGILKSTDCGITWNTTGLTYALASQGRKIRRLLINSQHPDTIIAVTNQGAFISSDAAATWVLAKSGLNFQDIEVKPDDPNTIYLSSTNGIYISTNAGFSFGSQNIALAFASPSSIGRIELEVTPANSNVIYALCSNATTDGFQYIYKSNDAGATWTQGATGPNIIGGDISGTSTDGNGWYNLSLAISPTNDNIVFVGGVNVWKSTNGGQSFQIKAFWVDGNGFPYVHADIHNITFRPVAQGSTTSSEVYIGCDGGVFKSNNVGQTWVDLSAGLQIMQLYRMSSSSNSPGYLIAGAQDNGTNFFNSNAPSQVYGGDGMDCTIDPSDDQNMYISTQNGNFARSVDGGASFDNMGPANQDGNGKWLTPMAISKSAPNNLYIGYKEIFKSSNNGGDWTSVTNISGVNKIQYIAVAPTDDNVVYACNDSKIFKSVDAGLTWAACMTGLPASMTYTQLTVSEDDPNIVYAVASNYTAINKVFKSTNGGGNWKNISLTGLPAVPVNSVICQRNNHERVYVGTDLGVYYTDTTLTVWKDFNNNLPNTYVMDFDIYYPTYTLYAATYGRGIWQTKLIVDNLENVSDVDFKSKVSIYPNPATNKLNISLDYESTYSTIINIFNINGSLVTESKISSNMNTASIDLSNFKSGTYLVKVSNGNKITHQKLVVIPN